MCNRVPNTNQVKCITKVTIFIDKTDKSKLCLCCAHSFFILFKPNEANTVSELCFQHFLCAVQSKCHILEHCQKCYVCSCDCTLPHTSCADAEVTHVITTTRPSQTLLDERREVSVQSLNRRRTMSDKDRGGRWSSLLRRLGSDIVSLLGATTTAHGRPHLESSDAVAPRTSWLQPSPSTLGVALGLAVAAASLTIIVHTTSHVKIGITRTLGLPVTSNHCPDESFSANNATTKNGTGRRLGLLERWYVAHSRRGNHTGITLAVEFDSSLPPPSLEETRQILHRVSLRFPMLRARLYRDGVFGMDTTDRLCPTAAVETKNRSQRVWGDDLYFWASHDTNRQYVRLEEWHVERNDQEGEGNGLRQVMEDQVARAWHDEDPSLPLWKATLIRWKGDEKSFALVLSFHHLIVDGLATTAVVQAIVEESARQANPPPDEDILRTDLPPPMEDVLDTVPRIYHIWRPLLLDLFPFLSFFLSPQAFSGRPKRKLATTRSIDNIACFELCNNQQLEIIRRICREKNVTVHTALVATLCKAIAIHVDRVQSVTRDYTWATGRLWNGNIRLRINNPVNERGRCSPPLQPSDLGCCISTTDLVIQAGPNSNLSKLEAEYLKMLRQHRQESPMTIGLIAFISQDWFQFSDKRAMSNRGDAVDSIDASNLGFVAMPESNAPSAWKVNGLWMASGRQNPAPALKANWVSTNRSGINMVLGALPQHFTRDDIVSVGSLFQILLRMEYLNPGVSARFQ